ncbi:MAG TPA: MBL fold metallo-hydrolase [Symbiobacteriaceae bacterium]|nr:MBL fold metallo-hydrolase [Symbiobacteriaceae bacterium]
MIRFRFQRSFFGLKRLYVHAFWVDGMLIDTGCAKSGPALLAALEREGCRPEQLVNTHTHEDHIGANRLIGERYGLTPQVHPLGLQGLAQPEPARQVHLYRLATWGAAPAGPLGAPLGDEIRTDRYRFQVRHTPGHAHDHVALYEPDQGWLFTGDLVLGAKILRCRPHEEPHQILHSLKSLASLPVSQIFCSHNWRVWDSSEILATRIAHWEGLAREAQRLQGEGIPEAAMMERLLGPFDPIELLSGGDFHRRHLLRGLLRSTEGGDSHLPQRPGRGTPA